MERLTKSIITIKDDVDLQTALDRLAEYEDAEINGDIVRTVREAFFVEDNTVFTGRVAEIRFVPLLVEEGPDFELWYDIKVYNVKEKREDLYTGKLGEDVFNTKAEAEAACFNF